MSAKFSKSDLKFITNKIANKTVNQLIDGDGSDFSYVKRRDACAEKFADEYQKKSGCIDEIKNIIKNVYIIAYTQKYLDDVVARQRKMQLTGAAINADPIKE